MADPIEDYELINAEPMDLEVFFDLLQLLKRPPDLQTSHVAEQLDIGEWMVPVIAECARRFPEDTRHVTSRRFMHRMVALVKAERSGMLADWRAPMDGEEGLTGAVSFAAAVCPLQPDGTFEPKEFLAHIGECSRILREELGQAAQEGEEESS